MAAVASDRSSLARSGRIHRIAKFDLDRLLRLEESIKAAAAIPADGAAAVGLTQSYGRLRGQVADLVSGTDLEAEFKATFPELPEVKGPVSNDPFEVQTAIQAGKVGARTAQAMLAQLAGWIGGIVRSMTFERQMELNAEAAAKLAAKRPPGFSAEP